jgi:putative hydrolase of the HAD superfamily
MVKAILFDFGGVIYRHPRSVIPRILAAIFNQPERIMAEECQQYKQLYFAGQISTRKLLQSLKAKFPINKDFLKLETEWLKVYQKLAQPDSQVLSLIKKLRGKYKIYLFTNTTEMSNRYNSRTGIYNYFDGLFCSFKTGKVKPNFEAYQFVLEKIRYQPAECLFIEDKPENLLPAQKLGMKTILFDVCKDKFKKLEDQLKNLGVF